VASRGLNELNGTEPTRLCSHTAEAQHAQTNPPARTLPSLAAVHFHIEFAHRPAATLNALQRGPAMAQKNLASPCVHNRPGTPREACPGLAIFWQGLAGLCAPNAYPHTDLHPRTRLGMATRFFQQHITEHQRRLGNQPSARSRQRFCTCGHHRSHSHMLTLRAGQGSSYSRPQHTVSTRAPCLRNGACEQATDPHAAEPLQTRPLLHLAGTVTHSTLSGANCRPSPAPC